MRISFFFYLLRTFCPDLGRFCVVSSFTVFRPNFTSGLLQVIYRDPRIGMLIGLSLVLITARSIVVVYRTHVFDQVNLWSAWVGFETAIFLTMLTWNCRDSTPLSTAPRAPNMRTKGPQ